MVRPAPRTLSVKAAALELLDYGRSRDWSGYDPYDALNSRAFRALPFLNFQLARLALTQAVKRSPVNLRPLLLVPRTVNPKGIALVVSALARLTRSGAIDGRDEIRTLVEKLLALRSGGFPRPCWGYNFDWQQRHLLVPRGSPNIICTTFAANALLDAQEIVPDPSWVEAATGAARFILESLFEQRAGGRAVFHYTMAGHDEVHNANLLGAAFVCRVGRLRNDPGFFEPALEAARFSVSRQRDDGSWTYGESPVQGWIDNFHTGFNLVALRRIGEYEGTAEFDPPIRKGFEFFKTHFIRADGAPKYFPDAVFPIDVHSAAQSIITLTEFADAGADNLALAHRVLDWTLTHLRSRRGYFYYQKRPHITIRTSFMRWSQAWMLLALSTLLSKARADAI